LNEYRTIACAASDAFVERRSRFIGYAKPVKTQQEAVDFIEEIKAKHWDATHNVYAYCLREGQIRRYSDDGEPQGTAGIPALDVLLKEGLTDCAVVCTRYFGGVLLGAGGLVRAYSHTAKIAVEAAGIITMSLCAEGELSCDYTLFGKLQPLLCRAGAVIADTAFADVVTLRFRIPAERWDALNAAVVDASFGKCACLKTGEAFAQIDG
jgi:uncharacterized YigZ family protein